MESSLVRASLQNPNLITPVEEGILRTALSLARVYKVRNEGRDVGVGTLVSPFRDEVTRKLGPALLGKSQPRRDQLLPLVVGLRESTLQTHRLLIERFVNRFPREALDREIRHKALVVVSGGGGGTGYVYLGALG